MKGILYINVMHATRTGGAVEEWVVRTAEESLQKAFPELKFATIRIYDNTPTHFDLLSDK